MNDARAKLLHALVSKVSFEPQPTPTNWIADNVYLSKRFAAKPGYIDLDLTPYMKEIVDTIINPSVRKVTLCCASQTGKSITLVGILSYIVANSDGQVVYALPTSESCDWFVQNRWKPIGEMSPAILREGGFERDNYRIKEQRFNNVTVSWIGSNSPSQAAMRSSPWLLLDEIDKMAPASDKEASFYHLVTERTKTFPLHKIIEASTPTVDTGNVWLSFLAGDQRFFHVPSPHAPNEPPFLISFELLRWDQTARHGAGDWDYSKVRKSAYIECPYTAKPIYDDSKNWMLRRGSWVATNPRADIRHRSYHLSSFYSPWLTFGEVAEKFLSAKKTPEGMPNFTNSWLAKPRVNRSKKTSEDVFTKLIEGSPAYTRGHIPNIEEGPPKLLLMTVDVQENCFYFVIRAYWMHGPSALIDYGILNSWEDVDGAFATKYPLEGNPDKTFSCLFGMCDAGFEAKSGADVYGFCCGHDRKPQKKRTDWIPSFGRSTKNVTALALSPVTDRPMNYKGTSLTAVFYNDEFWRTELYVMTLGQQGPAKDQWWLPRDLDYEYKSQLSNEVQLHNDDGSVEWKVIGDQHLADCEKLQRVVEFKLAGLFKR